jgi:hypothetical protein
MRPPLTVVLVNNGGGAIFSFLPVAEQVAPEAFSQLWSTPQNVDLAGTRPPLILCRAPLSLTMQSRLCCGSHVPNPSDFTRGLSRCLTALHAA